MLVPEGEAMVEIKYDESKSHLKLPKNIRQIGRPDNRIKIYVEDYVVTYLNQVAQETPQEERLAILLGDTASDEDTAVVFVSGAVAAVRSISRMSILALRAVYGRQSTMILKSILGKQKLLGGF